MIQALTAFFILLLLMAPALGMISEFQAASAAKSYQKSDEVAFVYGPYTYNSHQYY
jgi:hypothetical protein